MEYSVSSSENKSMDKKNMTYLAIGLIAIFVLIFLIYVFNQGEEMKGFKSFFNKKETIVKVQKEEDDEEIEEAEKIVNKALNNANIKENKCKNKVYKKLGISSCTSKYVPPI